MNQQLAADLRAAKALIDTPEKWTQRVYARDSMGFTCESENSAAVCFCSLGALFRVIPETAHDRFKVQILRENGVDFVYAWSFSKSGAPRRHVRACIVGRDVLSEHERLELQAILGSDRKRELLAWLQIEKGWNPTPTLFFELR